MTKASFIGKGLTSDQDTTIRGILSRVEYTPKPRQSVSWGIAPDGSRDWGTARALVRDLYAYKPAGGCIACHFKVMNYLREAIDQPPVGGEASESLRERRLAICRGVSPDGADACPAYHNDTDSCGRPVVDAFTPEPVTMHDGTRIEPCGCFVAVKASFKFFKCPAGRWPRK